MNEDDMLRRIKDSAEETEIPQSLDPENVQNRLTADGKKILGDARKARFRKRVRIAGIAAAAVLIALLLPNALYFAGRLQKGTAGAADSAASQTDSPGSGKKISRAEKTDFAAVLISAGNYQAVFQKLKDSASSVRYTYGIAAEDAGAKTSAAAATGVNSALAENAGSASGGDFSETNLREAGVEEGDVVKTDGQYIYAVHNNADVQIFKADGGQVEKTADVKMDTNGTGMILDMYVSGDRMILIEQDYASSLDPAEASDTYEVHNRGTVHAVTYDITDRTNPVSAGSISADGYYQTSRLTDGVLYLMTQYSADYTLYSGDAAYNENAALKGGLVPCVNQEPVPAEDIYIPQEMSAEAYLVLTSVRISDPSAAVDSKAVLSYSSNMYVSQDAIFLDATSWMQWDGTTIARINFSDGSFTPAGACTVPGTIDDSFSMDEASDGTFRAASTVYGDTSSCGVYTFDKDMNSLGSVTGIAEGENLRSARFLDHVCYLVTYKNMDPLFTVDLSDPKNPVLLGELSISGFSEYLHFWGEDKLLGFGYETDPETGEFLGLKLSMFDISDPSNVSEISKIVLKNVTDSSALADYKAMLIQPEKNILGFAASENSYVNGGADSSYMVFQYTEEGFVNVFSTALTEETYTNIAGVRGIYIGSTFYLVGSTSITAYDMNNGFLYLGTVLK